MTCFLCTRCNQEGEYYKNRIRFSYSKRKSAERSHEDYVNMLNDEHHVGETLSSLVELPEVNVVHPF